MRLSSRREIIVTKKGNWVAPMGSNVNALEIGHKKSWF
jgi:hypothetical protein